MAIFFIPAVTKYTHDQIWVFWVAFFLSIGFLIGLTCCGDVRRKTPHNFILLSGFTIAEGLMLGVSTSTYSANEVLLGIVQKFRNRYKFDLHTNSKYKNVCNKVSRNTNKLVFLYMLRIMRNF